MLFKYVVKIDFNKKTGVEIKKMKRNINFKILMMTLCFIVIGALITFNVVYTMATGTHLRSGTKILDNKASSQYTTKIQSQRGSIKDVNGNVIAKNINTYTLVAVLDKNRLGDYSYVQDREFTAKALAPILDMSEEKIMEYLNLQDQGVYQTYLGDKGKNLTLSQKKAIEEIVYTPDPEKKTTGLPGIEFEKTISRVYTPGQFSSTLLGFANYDNDEERIVGQVGVEAYMDNVLTGQDGKAIEQKDGKGYTIPGTSKVVEEAVDGSDVYLTIDKDIQEALEECLRKTVEDNNAVSAWAIVMEVETGRILAYGGSPTYDLNNREEVLYMDIPSMYTFEPGSVLKPFTYAAAIEEGVYDEDITVKTGKFCVGYKDGYTKIYRKDGDCSEYGNINDANRKGWGYISLDEGLVRSSNVCIAEILTKYLDVEVFWEYIEKLGFFKPTGIEGLEMSEESGLKNNTYPIEKLSFGFGQGSSVTALQLMQAYTAIYNDGHMVKPYYIDKIVDSQGNITYEGKTTYVNTDEEGNSIPVFSKETTDYVVNIMRDVIQDQKIGTGMQYNIDGLDMAGKTGTGEVFDDGTYHGAISTSNIMAAAPASDPKIMIYYGFQSSNIYVYDRSFYKNLFITAFEKMGLNQTKTNDEKVYEDWNEYEMPSFENTTLEFAKNRVKGMELNTVFIGEGENVISQYPQAGESVYTNQQIFIKLSDENITLPNMKNWTYKDVMAYKEISGLNIQCEGNGTVVSQSVEKDTVIIDDTEIVVTLE